MQVTVGAITVTAQATSSPDRHDTQGSGDFYLATNGDIHLAISGDLQLATNGDFHVATDSGAVQKTKDCRPFGVALRGLQTVTLALRRAKSASDVNRCASMVHRLGDDKIAAGWRARS